MLPQNWFNIPGALFGGLVSGVTQPIFNGRKLKTQHEVAKLERDKAEIGFQHTVMDAVHEVTKALDMIDKVNEQLAIAQQRVATSQLGVKTANLLFTRGEATYLEAIAVPHNALNSELDFVIWENQTCISKEIEAKQLV